jgi:hypothetical protein
MHEFPSVVIPAYPYEGGLYWLLGEGSVRHDASWEGGTGYYKNAYGPQPEESMRHASALVALFEEIQLAPLDHALPEMHAYTVGGTYRHPDLRLTRSDDIGEWAPDAEELADYLIRTKGDLRALLEKGGQRDDWAKKHFVCRVILQARFAARTRAVLIGNELFEAVYQHVLPSMGAFIEGWPLEGPESKSLALTSRALNLTGLCLPAPNYDVFCEIRRSKEIAQYAKAFRGALGAADASGGEVQDKLLALMREARENREVAKRAAGVLQDSGSWTSIVGAVAGALPGVGALTGLAGLGADLAGRRAARTVLDHSWFTLGSRLQELNLDVILTRP